MRKFYLVIVLFILFCGCGPSPEYSKHAKSYKILKNGSLEVIDELKDGQRLPQTYYVISFDKKDRAIKREYFSGGTKKRSADILYDKDGKITEIRLYEKDKYNGVSKFVYDDTGNIEKEMVYDESLNFLFSKKY
jgi:antitoxin component YwqK of YwqJK toxin-antitoxin module